MKNTYIFTSVVFGVYALFGIPFCFYEFGAINALILVIPMGACWIASSHYWKKAEDLAEKSNL